MLMLQHGYHIHNSQCCLSDIISAWKDHPIICIADVSYTLSKAHAYCSFQSLLHIPQAMDTTSTAGSAASVSFRVEPSVKLAGEPNVIQTYKGIVKGMVGLMLRLSHEGLTPALTQELEGAACALVSFLSLHAIPAHW